MADSQTNENNTCVVCFKNVLYFSIGECDHPVCFECSTRMRVLCQQNECPICRQDLARVVFTDSIQPYKDLRNQVFSDKLFERQFKIGFCSEDIRNAYERLLEHNCNTCDKLPPFRNFSALSDHMRKVHEKYFCDLCVKHLKIFTSERRCYTRQELAHHRRKGDPDNTSHRGHPLCEFCEERFMDADELYRHLRKEHLYCHLCDADGRNLYYATHSALAQHFRTDHYLCEEGECAEQHLTSVFRSEIDLKAHKASVHGKGLARYAARQARTLEVQFNITPHPVASRPNHRNARFAENPEPAPVAPAPAPPRIDPCSDEQFPRLSTAAPAPVLVAGPVRPHYNAGPDGLARTDRNFPALDGNNPSRPPNTAAPNKSTSVAATLLRNTKPSVSIQLHSQPASASNFRLTQPTGNRISIPTQQRRPPLSDDDFPSLGRDGREEHISVPVQPPKVTMINSQEMKTMKSPQQQQQPTKKPQLSSDAFPALSSSSTPTCPPQWIKVSKSKDKGKPAKPEPPPPREPNFNPAADFPTLPINNTKTPKSKKPAPAPQIPTQNSQKHNELPKTGSKKEKKKNNKKENLIDVNFGSLNEKNHARDVASVLSNVNNNQTVSATESPEEKKIKTVEETMSKMSVNSAKTRNSGNGDFALKPKDYPPLNKSEPEAPIKMPNGRIPPGFGKVRPKPACDGMTFTNSSGQTFSAPIHNYIPPPGFENRNRELVKKFAAALGGNEALDEFKVASRAFRDSLLTADEFYQHCQRALGSQLDNIFPELVALLPDIAKQQELVVGTKYAPSLAVCSTCGQLLTQSDVIAHDTAHWPPLTSR